MLEVQVRYALSASCVCLIMVIFLGASQACLWVQVVSALSASRICLGANWICLMVKPGVHEVQVVCALGASQICVMVIFSSASQACLGTGCVCFGCKSDML